jgi:hypothetical protein
LKNLFLFENSPQFKYFNSSKNSRVSGSDFEAKQTDFFKAQIMLLDT